MENKYGFTGELLQVGDVTLRRIVALRDFAGVKAGDKGGWIEKESNLSQFGNAWVYGNAWVSGNARVFGDAWVSGDAWVRNNSDYIVFKNFWSSGRYFTYTFSNKMWTVGCFHGTGDELIKKAYADSEDIGWHYEQTVRYVEAVEQRRLAESSSR